MALKPNLNVCARANHQVKAQDVLKVLSHRPKTSGEEYLIQWRTTLSPSRSVASWHPVSELVSCAQLIQTYVEATEQTRQFDSPGHLAPSSHGSGSRKRKSPGGEPISAAGTPGAYSLSSGASSVISVETSTSSSHDAASDTPNSPSVYNGYLVKKAGRITAREAKGNGTTPINTESLPTTEMTEAAKRCPMTAAERMVRQCFYNKLNAVPKLYLENKVDSSTPNLDFTFINEFVLREGVSKLDPETNIGCQKPCKPNMGGNQGCEYTKLCDCLEFAVVNEKELQRTMPEVYKLYLEFKEEGGDFDTRGAPKKFPYQVGRDGRPSTLQEPYFGSRQPIYECNANCNCGPRCKTRVAQKGRKVGLTIFRTADNRGWGLYCNEDLVQGEFIDTYLGEVITNEEADRRELESKKASYLYSLDKFVGDNGLSEDDCYVVDGEHMGGPTRFINHSCEPNCRQYVVSYNRFDQRIYDLAFFAYEDIPKGTELTFDYMDKDDVEDEDLLKQASQEDEEGNTGVRVPCRCGSANCRGYLWI